MELQHRLFGNAETVRGGRIERSAAPNWFETTRTSNPKKFPALFAAIGFTEQLRYMIVLLDNIQPIRTFPIPECRLSSFSPNGQYLAVVHKSAILIYSTISFQVLKTFRGHGAKITSLVWTRDDRKLVSCGVEGAVYEWDLATGNRIGEIVEKGTSFWKCAVTPEGKYVYAVGNDGLLKEITESNVSLLLGISETYSYSFSSDNAIFWFRPKRFTACCFVPVWNDGLHLWRCWISFFYQNSAY